MRNTTVMSKRFNDYKDDIDWIPFWRKYKEGTLETKYWFKGYIRELRFRYGGDKISYSTFRRRLLKDNESGWWIV